MQTLSKQTSWTLNLSHREQINSYKFSLFITDTLGTRYMYVPNLRSGVPYIFGRGRKVRLIQLLDYLSAAP